MNLSIQETAGLVSLLIGVLVVGIVIFLISTSSQGDDTNSATEKVYKVRKSYFIGLVITVVLALTFTLQALPYENPESHKNEKPTTVGVVGVQWLWRMADTPLTENPADFTGSSIITLNANEPIQFEVTTVDVNHNFGVYNSEGRLLIQTQAMPGFVNRLNHTFEPGEYEILCMEYCGLPHGIMIGKIIVE